MKKPAFKWTPTLVFPRKVKPMTLAELKRRIKPGMRLRLVRGVRKPGRQDTMRVVTAANTAGFQMEGEDIKPGKGPMYIDWPKAKNLRGTELGFVIVGAHGQELEYEWVDEGMISQSPKDRTVDFLLNSLEHCESDAEAIVSLGDALGNHVAADAVIVQWNALAVLERNALEKPEVCDRSLRSWLDTVWDWAYVPQTIDA